VAQTGAILIRPFWNVNPIFVQNIGFSTGRAALSAAFSKLCEINNVRILTYWTGTGGISRGIGFVQFETAEGFDAALAATAPVVCEGRCLKIDPRRDDRR
jgi:hypothetical protein